MSRGLHSVLYILSLCIFRGAVGDLGLYGNIQNGLLLVDDDARSETYSTCFMGAALVTCRNDIEYSNDNLFYYQFFNDNYGVAYCLQCCGNHQKLDIWDLSCAMDGTAAGTVNLYGREMRFARARYPGDTEIVTCPIKRSACIYNEATGKLMACDSLYDKTYLHGYTVDIHVVMYEDGFNFWRGVESCNVREIIETNISYVYDNMFYEKYYMHYTRAPYQPTAFHGIILLCLLSLLSYVILYFARKAHCLVCGKKLVICSQRCIMCRFYGAPLPDPNLIKALEEKGTMMNDPSDGDVCCCDCRMCTARGQLYRKHKKKLNKIVAVNVEAMERGAAVKEEEEQERVPSSKHLSPKKKFVNTGARTGDVAEMKVDELLIYQAVGHPMYKPDLPNHYKFGTSYKPIEIQKIFPPK